MLPALFDKTKKQFQVDSSDSEAVVLDFTAPDTKCTSLNASTGPLGSVETTSAFSSIFPNDEGSTTSSQERTASQSTLEGRTMVTVILRSNAEDSSSITEYPENKETPDISQPLLPVAITSIADRFFRSHEIRLMSGLPEVSDLLKFTTIITPEGLFQLNQETHTFKCLLDTDQLDILGLSNFVEYSERSTQEDGVFIYDALTRNDFTLEHLRMLERAVVDVSGHSVIGYTINEKVWIGCIGYIFREQYPPKSDAYSRQLLDVIYLPIIIDTLLSLKVALFSFTLFKALGASYFHEDPKNNSTFYAFEKQNVQWIVSCLFAFIALNFFLLRSGYLHKPTVSARLNCIQQIERYMIGFLKISSSETLASILLKLFGSEGNTIAIYSILPLMILAIKLGSHKNHDVACNVFHHPRLSTLLNGLRYALITSSFISLGLLIPIFDVLHFMQQNLDDDYPLKSEANNILAIIQSAVFVIIMLANMSRYPYAFSPMQAVGRYTSNVSNAIGNVFLGSFAIILIEYLLVDLFSSIFHQSLAWSKPWSQPVFVGLQSVVFLCAFIIEFPRTPNLPELSIEPIPPGKTWCEEISERIEPIRNCFQHSRKIVTPIKIFGIFGTTSVTPTQMVQDHINGTIENPIQNVNNNSAII